MNFNKTIISIGLITVIMLGILLTGCNEEEETIKIGVLSDLSGDYAALLRGTYRGAVIAEEDIEKELGVNIELIIEDQKSCNSKETVTIMNKFVNIDKVDFIVGGTCSSTTLAAAPIANRAKTVMISPASSAPSIRDAGDYIFRTYISDNLRAEKSAELVYELGYRNMAVIKDISNSATVEVAESGKKEFIILGGNIVIEEEINLEDRDFKTQLSKIKNSDIDVLYLSLTSPKQIALMAKQIKELGLDIKIIVPLETVQDPSVFEVGGDALNGLMYVIPGKPPASDALDELKIKYNKKYNENNIPSYFAEAYDATWLGVKAVLASDGSKESIKDKLYEVSRSYQGVSGNVSFDENGDVSKSVLFKQIKDGEFLPYEAGK